ncbi:unnamed protein product [Rotaria sordida]|uniref:Uncharacterized protein n=1 Tax=Rotaria sordida TaxID=392033 RepID=A0A813QZE3_9BILA|nr:unnamed protein product [Rotaria sordida]CAF3520555.1 unnamed protein product [Rotaria sordida]
MAQSQGYKRFRSSINTVYHGTSTPQTSNNKIFPRASTPNPRSIDPIEQQTIPVVSSPRSKMTVHHKIHKKRRQHRPNNHQYQIHIDHIVLIQQQKKPCSHCHCKKTKAQRIIGIL